MCFNKKVSRTLAICGLISLITFLIVASVQAANIEDRASSDENHLDHEQGYNINNNLLLASMLIIIIIIIISMMNLRLKNRFRTL